MGLQWFAKIRELRLFDMVGIRIRKGVKRNARFTPFPPQT